MVSPSAFQTVLGYDGPCIVGSLPEVLSANVLRLTLSSYAVPKSDKLSVVDAIRIVTSFILDLDSELYDRARLK